MRVNVDSAIFGDARLKRLAKVLGVRWTEALGALVATWHHCYQLRLAVVSVDDVDAVADIDGLAAAIVAVGLGAWAGKGRVRVAGVTERIAWLERQSEKSARGVEARRKRVNPEHDPVVNPRVDPVVGNNQPSGQPYSPSLAPALSPSPSLAPDPALEIPTRARRQRVERVVTVSSTAADLAAHLFESIRSHSPGFEPDSTLQAWALELDVGLRAGVSAADFREGIDYAHRSDETFWRGNILSAKKLRKQIQTLLVQARQRTKPNGKPRQPDLLTTEQLVAMARGEVP